MRMGESQAEIERDVQAVGRIGPVPLLLRILRETTGMGFAAVARVSAESWTACVVADGIDFGLKPGDQLDVTTTLCAESRASGQPIVIACASTDITYRDHRTPKLYRIESYVSVPIVLPNGRYFGNLCAIDPLPVATLDPRTVTLFTRFAEIIATQLETELAHEADHAALLDERATSELREHFIAILGHDLRSPLQAVYASSDLLARKLTDPVLVGLAARIKTNARRMSTLIDDVLDFARGRLGGGIGIDAKDTADVAAGLAAVVKESQDAHPDRLIKASLSVHHSVCCDIGRIQQVASNLLANAMVHGARASAVEVAARTDERSLIIDVWNEGEPIPRESLSKIFQPFWRRSAASGRDGLGLGLYICSQIAHAHGGDISVVSNREQGTRFTVRLPLAGSSGPSGATPPP